MSADLPIYLNVQNHIGLYDDVSIWANRIHSISIRVEPAYWRPIEITRAITICDGTDGKIALVAGPFASWISPRYPLGRPATDRGSEYAREINRYRDQFGAVAKRLDRRKDLVGAILIDAEYWKRSSDPVHNTAMAETLDTLYAQAHDAFPKARIEFYCRGIYWDLPSVYWTELERFVPNLSVSLSCPNHPAMMERWFNATIEIAKARGLSDITPWVHIGCGYDLGNASHYNMDLSVPASDAQRIGEFLRASPYVKCVVIHPGPNGTDNWTNHFNNFMAGLGR